MGTHLTDIYYCFNTVGEKRLLKVGKRPNPQLPYCDELDKKGPRVKKGKGAKSYKAKSYGKGKGAKSAKSYKGKGGYAKSYGYKAKAKGYSKGKGDYYWHV